MKQPITSKEIESFRNKLIELREFAWYLEAQVEFEIKNRDWRIAMILATLDTTNVALMDLGARLEIVEENLPF